MLQHNANTDVALKHNLPTALIAALLLYGIVAPAFAQAKLESLSARDPRRTPIVEVFHQWKDAVVYLTGPMSTGAGPSMDEFFKVPQKRETISIGSGFFVHPSGYIVTNAHAAEKVISQHATLSDGRTYQAEMVGLARDKDLALLKIQSDKPLRAVQLAKSGDFLLGETVIVIGNPAGLMHTCTQGIVSAANRSTQSASLPGVVLHGLIQSDAGINAGSSGGPWFNVLGQVIGITTAIRAGTQNIGFAIPVGTLRQVLPDMLDVEHQESLVTGLELQPQGPCAVLAAVPGSPAAAACLQHGDILARLDDKPVDDRCDFCLALLGRKPGETLKLELRRQEKLLRGSLVLGARPKPDGAALLQQRYGLTAVPLDAEKAHATAMRVNRGVVITAVNPAAPYTKLQTPPQPGDVLARINDIRPRDLDHVGQLLDRLKPGDTVHFVLLRMKDHVAMRVDLTLTLNK
jgi:serine protease Do